MLQEFPAIYHRIRYTGESNDAYTNGEQYYVHFYKMTDGRYAVFKTLHHFKEDPGYKVYSTLEEINKIYESNS